MDFDRFTLGGILKFKQFFGFKPSHACENTVRNAFDSRVVLRDDIVVVLARERDLIFRVLKLFLKGKPLKWSIDRNRAKLLA